MRVDSKDDHNALTRLRTSWRTAGSVIVSRFSSIYAMSTSVSGIDLDQIVARLHWFFVAPCSLNFSGHFGFVVLGSLPIRLHASLIERYIRTLLICLNFLKYSRSKEIFSQC